MAIRAGADLGRVGRVAVDQHVDVGLHRLEHVPDDVAFALSHGRYHRRPVLAGDAGSGVRGVVVEDVDGRTREG